MARLGRAEREVPKFGSRPPRTLEQALAEVYQLQQMLPSGHTGYDAQADLRGHRTLRTRLVEREPSAAEREGAPLAWKEPNAGAAAPKPHVRLYSSR